MITLGGKAGAGKTTVTHLLAQSLSYEIIAIGAMKRALAQEMNISISEFNALGEREENIDAFDRAFERYQQTLDPLGPIILDSRLGFYNQPHAFKVFLDVDPRVSAERIFSHKRETDPYESIEEVMELTVKRNLDDDKRWATLYGPHFLDLTHYDLVIDTSHEVPEEIVHTIILAYQDWKTKQ